MHAEKGEFKKNFTRKNLQPLYNKEMHLEHYEEEALELTLKDCLRIGQWGTGE